MGSCCENLAASLRHKVVIQSETQTPDGQGGFTSSWTNGATVWCSIQPVKAYERYQAMQVQVPATHKIVMRYRSDLTAKSRLKIGDSVFEIKEVIDVDLRRRFLEIKAIERSN